MIHAIINESARVGRAPYRWSRHARPSLIVAFALLACTAFTAAPTNVGGTYTYTGNPPDMRTTGQTGDQTWIVKSPISIRNFFPGQTDIVPYWQIYTGESITDSGQARVMKGNVVFENAVKWTGLENYIGYTGPAKLVLRNGGSLTATANPIRIGVSYQSGTTGNATVFMEEPSRLTAVTNNIIVGNTLPGAIWMDGGILSITNAALTVGNIAAAPGYIRLNGGEISLRSGSADAAFIGNSASYSSVHVSGGMMKTRRSGTPSEVYFKAAVGKNRATDIYVDGGFVDFWNERLGLGYWEENKDASGARASLTVDGEGRFLCHLPVMGRLGKNGIVAININGGRFELSRGLAHYNNMGNRRCLNFAGGTLALVQDSRTSQNTGSLDNTAQNIVYPGGAIIEVPFGVSATSSATFRKAEGYGVSDITLTSAGSGYVTAPEVKITGGVGSNATAYAVLNKDRTLEKIVVTCRGEGYAANDEVAVTIVSETGSGAAATATLAPNAGGIIRKTGSGALRLSTSNNTFDGDVEIVEGALTPNGAGFTAAFSLRMYDGTILRPITGTTSTMNRLDVTNGVIQIRAENTSSGDAMLNIGALSVNQGLALVTHTNRLALALTATDLTETSSSESPVVNGMVYANKDASQYRSPRVIMRNADGTLSPAPGTSTPGPDANWIPNDNIDEADAPEISEVNSVTLALTPPVKVYVKSSGLINIKSGMILVRRPQPDTQRLSVTGGGAFTTRAKGGMFIYADQYQTARRSLSRANNDAVYVDQRRRIFGPFADPDGSTPMALTIAGENQGRPELGVMAYLLGVQTFSGGLNLVNGGVFIQADSGLGASGSPVRASGYCSISSYNWTFNISHPIELLDGSALIFLPYSGNQGNTVSSTLSGSGDLLTSDVNRPGYAMAFTGDHSSFTGDYYIQGHSRTPLSVYSAQAGIRLADGTNGVGVIETSGTLTRPAGTGKGEICWKTHKAYANLGYGLRGGFAARGGDLTVNLGGAGAKLVVGSDYLPVGTVIQLQSQYPENESQGPGGKLTFMNGFELGGKTQNVRVWPGKTATFAGALSDAVGGGMLAVTGNLALEGATFEIAPANVAAPMLTVNGALALGGTLTIALDPACVEGREEITLATATGGVSGTPTVAGNVPSQWTLTVRSNSLVLKKLNGTMLIVR